MTERSRNDPPPPELVALLARDATVRGIWTMFRAGDLSYEQCLLSMVNELAKRNEAFREAEYERALRAAGVEVFRIGEGET